MLSEDIEFQNWLKTRPPVIQDLAGKYPPQQYRIKEGAPYGVSCEGTTVDLIGWRESGEVIVVVRACNKLPKAIEHEKMLGETYNKSDEEMKMIHEADIQVYIDPIWMEAIN